MKVQEKTLIQFEDIEFDHSRQLLKVDFFDYQRKHRTVYTDFWDFEQWVTHNSFLKENCSYKPISLDDLFTEDCYLDYRNKLAEDFFKELLNIYHLEENLNNKLMVAEFQEEVAALAKRYGSRFQLSA